MLELLFRHAGEVLSKPFLYQQVLHRGYSQHDRSLDMHVSNVDVKFGVYNIANKEVTNDDYGVVLDGRRFNMGITVDF